jgi:preprotein translocase subunit SecE
LGVQVPPALPRSKEIDPTKGKPTMPDVVTPREENKLGLLARVGLFYRQVVSELRKVVWPTRKQLTTYTAVVLVFVSFIIAVVSLLDLVLTKIVFLVFG